MSASGRKASAWDIRRSVEEYAGMSDDTFSRRFYADRAELLRLGIEIMSDGNESQSGKFLGSARYWLPPENYRLPPIDFSSAEMAALNACLWLLEGQFAYSNVLRLALQGLALAAGSPLEALEPNYISLNLLPMAIDRAAAGRLAKIEHAIAQNKSIVFKYHAAARNRTEERRVDPYALMISRGDWYMVGFSHERSGIRVFKLGRIGGKIHNATRKTHDFILPEDFDPRHYQNLEPWQLGPAKGRAVVSLSPRISWRIERELGHCGSFEPGGDGETLFATAYTDEKQLCSLVLGMESDATLIKPAFLRQMMGKLLETIAARHSGQPKPIKAAAVKQPPQSEAGSPGQVKPERFTRLSTLSAYLTDRLGDAESIELAAAEVADRLGYESIGSLKQDTDLLLLVCIDAGAYLVEAYIEDGRLRVERCVYGHLLKKPARLSPLEARALLLAIDLVGEHAPQGSSSLKSARMKIIEASGGVDDGQTIIVHEAGRDDATAGVIARGIEEHRLVEIDFLSETSDRPRKRRIEPYLIIGRGSERYVVSFCRRAGAERIFRFRMIKQAALLDERFQPREIDLDRYRHAQFPSGSEAPLVARVHFSAAAARFVNERMPAAVMLEDGSLVDEIPYFNHEWLAREVLKYGGEAIVLSPAEPRRLVAATAKKLAIRYS